MASNKIQIYVILRHDSFPGIDFNVTQSISGTKAYFDKRVANDEVKRLNSLNKEKGCVYFVKLARIVDSQINCRLEN